MATTKPDLTRVWANTAPPANVVDPDTTTPGKVDSGWQAEVPPFEHFNFLQKWFTQGLAHFNEQGIGVWDTDTTYPVYGLAKGSDGNVYEAVSEQSGNNPITDNGTNWVRFNLLFNDLRYSRSFSSLSDMLSDSELRLGSKVTVGGYNTNSDGGFSEFEVVDIGDPIGIPNDSNTFKLKRMAGHDYVKTLLKTGQGPKVSAHRGWHGTSPNELPGNLPSEVYFVPENTIESIRYAANLGAFAMEGDTKITSDGVLVVFHDDTVDRTTNGTGPVSGYTLAGLKALDAGSYVSPRYANSRVMTYDEWFMWCRKTGVVPMAEISATLTNAQADGLVADMEKHFSADCRGVMILSTNINTLRQIRERNAYVCLGLIPSFGSPPTIQQLDDMYKVGNGIIMLTGNVPISNPEVIDDMNERGLASAYAIANTPEQYQSAIDLGIDIIVTDFIPRG